ncbi:sorbosone dehydrogenase family protein [Cupriavidus pauculus]|uniref:PQQ-dependent sugar dehydrogenase n=1 Tax=Cupriavidus pauculus TaxID=82633 RepID=UPI00208AF394|nr:sorbosone dehydrogenase family protein [Cupriavidus pauculus]
MRQYLIYPMASLFAIVAVTLLVGCGESARLPEAAGYGPAPKLPAPDKTAIPTIHVAPAKGWENGKTPVAGDGMRVVAFGDQLEHPRWVYVLPNGDVLVAETDAPPKPDDGNGIRGWIMKTLMKKAGSGTPSANRITLLRDTDGDGVADQRSVFLQNLNSPFGMALVGNDFYVANTDAVVRFRYTPGQTSIAEPGQKLVDLPAGPINHHWTKNIIASPDGSKLYVTVGSNSNVGENGIDKEAGRAAIWEVDRQSGQHRVFASGLRNPNGMAWEPATKALWTSVNERDEIGSDLVPDYITSVRDGGFYGWPFSYYGQHVDERVKPPAPDKVAKAVVPDYAVGAHTAALGLTGAAGNSLPSQFQNGMFVSQHGSWNRKPRAGYRVIFVPFDQGKPSGAPLEVLTGFLDGEGNAQGRPVGVAVDQRGGLLVADDVGNRVWRVSGAH